MAGASRVFRPFVMVLGGCCCCSAEGTAAAALVQGPRSRWSARHRGAGRSGLGVRGACVDMIKVYCEHYRELCDEDINMDGSGPGIDCPESKSVVMLCRCDLDSSFPVLLQRSPAEPRWIPRAGGVCKLQSCSGVRHNSPISPRKENKRATGCMFGNGPFRCDQRRSWDRMDGEGDIRWTLERRTGRGRLKTTTLSGTSSSASDHGPGMSRCLSTRPKHHLPREAMSCRTARDGGVRDKLDGPPNLWHVARDPSCCDTPPNSILDFLMAN